jgi:hypothetical protein
MSYGELVIALFVVAVLFIAFTYEDPRASGSDATPRSSHGEPQG